MRLRSSLTIVPLVGAGSLLAAHLLTAAAFRRRTDAMIARLEHASGAEMAGPPDPGGHPLLCAARDTRNTGAERCTTAPVWRDMPRPSCSLATTYCRAGNQRLRTGLCLVRPDADGTPRICTHP